VKVVGSKALIKTSPESPQRIRRRVLSELKVGQFEYHVPATRSRIICPICRAHDLRAEDGIYVLGASE